eukprot:1147428-Pelagomonas_calceolata.AAC.3
MFCMTSKELDELSDESGVLVIEVSYHPGMPTKIRAKTWLRTSASSPKASLPARPPICAEQHSISTAQWTLAML